MANSCGDFCGVMCGVVCAVLVATAFPVTQITLGAVYLHECPAGPAVPLYLLVSGVVTLLVMSQAVVPRLFPPEMLGKIWLCWVVCLGLFTLSWFIYGSYHIYSIYQPSYTKPTVEPNGSNSSAYSSPEPSVESLNHTLFNHTWDMDSNFTSVPLGNLSSEMKEEVLKVLRVAGVMDAAPYCNRTLYLFAFWTTTLVYGFAALGLAMSAFFYGCFMLVALLTTCVSE